MSIIELVNQIMHTSPRKVEDTQPHPKYGRDVREAHAKVNRIRRDLDKLDAAVSVAEARLRARGVILPDDQSLGSNG